MLCEFAQCFDQGIARGHRWREWRIALILQAPKTSKIKIISAARGTHQDAAPHDDERDPGHAVQAFIGGSRHCLEAYVGEVKEFGTEATDAVDQYTHFARSAQLCERLQIIVPSGRGLVVHDCQMRKWRIYRRGVELRGDRVEIWRLSLSGATSRRASRASHGRRRARVECRVSDIIFSQSKEHVGARARYFTHVFLMSSQALCRRYSLRDL